VAKGPAPREFTPEELALLGNVTDAEAADRIGLSRNAVGKHRRRRQIAPKHRHGPSPRPWTQEEDALLGTMSDQAVADRLGVSLGLVWKRRTELGIPTFSSRKGAS